LNGVIAAATIEGINQGYEVIGIRDGFKWLAAGDVQQCRPLSIRDVKDIHLRGGSILGTARTNPTKSEEQMRNVFTVFEKLGITALVTIGGDDTAFTASEVARRSRGEIKVAHVPKTIDNDLPLPGSTPTFGYETARHYGVFLVRNLMEDARTTSRWYLIVSMGRAAGHLALGIAKAAAATLAIISEEFRGRQVTADEVCDIIIGSIIKRRAEGGNYGIAVLAEGLIESMGEQGLLKALPEGELQHFGKVVRDDHGHLRLGEIEFGRLMKELLNQRLEKLGIKMTFIDKDLGYELRCADPIPFDAEYTRDLGYAAVKFLRSPEAEKYGAIISFVDGKMNPLPFANMLDPKTGRMQNRKVNVDGEAYECACAYMIRLERSDFEDAKKLARLAAVVNHTPEQFRARFGYLVGVK
jgi:6-phosphofructokinase 1